MPFPEIVEHRIAAGVGCLCFNDALRAAILNSQHYGQVCRIFCERAMMAVVQSYYTFLAG
jgi:hypothetical protein